MSTTHNSPWYKEPSALILAAVVGIAVTAVGNYVQHTLNKKPAPTIGLERVMSTTLDQYLIANDTSLGDYTLLGVHAMGGHCAKELAENAAEFETKPEAVVNYARDTGKISCHGIALIPKTRYTYKVFFP